MKGRGDYLMYSSIRRSKFEVLHSSAPESKKPVLFFNLQLRRTNKFYLPTSDSKNDDVFKFLLRIRRTNTLNSCPSERTLIRNRHSYCGAPRRAAPHSDLTPVYGEYIRTHRLFDLSRGEERCCLRLRSSIPRNA